MNFPLISFCGRGPAQTQMIVMRTDNNRLIFQIGICARNYSDNIFNRSFVSFRVNNFIPNLEIRTVVGTGKQSGAFKFFNDIFRCFFDAFGSRGPPRQFFACKILNGFHHSLRGEYRIESCQCFAVGEICENRIGCFFSRVNNLCAQRRIYCLPFTFTDIRGLGAFKYQVAVFSVMRKFAGQTVNCILIIDRNKYCNRCRIFRMPDRYYNAVIIFR